MITKRRMILLNERELKLKEILEYFCGFRGNNETLIELEEELEIEFYSIRNKDNQQTGYIIHEYKKVNELEEEKNGRNR